MITLYTNSIVAQKSGYKVIKSVDLTFDKIVYKMELNQSDIEIMKKIDNAKYCGDGMIETQFGRTEIQSLSSGCKTLILLNHCQEIGNPIINISECGKNALDYVFELNNIKVLLEFMLSPNKYNGEKIINVVSKKGMKQSKLREVFGSKWIG